MNKWHKPKLLSVVVPARDEANCIGSLISEVREVLRGYPQEVIVVDDGSKDETRKIAQSNDAVVVSHDKALGKGAAMKTGVQNAKGDIIVFIDGDGAYHPRDIPRLIAPILEEKADLVIGSRALPGSSVPVRPLVRRLSNDLASVTISFVISIALPFATLFKCPLKYVRVTDCTSGFRAITKQGWQKLNLISQGFEIETEMIYEAARNKLTLAETPISCNWDSRISHLSILDDGLKTLKLLAGKLLHDMRGR